MWTSIPNPIHLWQKAERLIGHDPSGAAALYVELSRHATFATAARLRLSLIEQGRGDLQSATRHAMDAFQRRGSDPDELAMLCKRLFSLGEIESAIRCAEAPAVMGGPADVVAEVGKLMTDAFQPALALALLQRAFALGLRTPGVHYLLGLARTYCGDLDGARHAYEACLDASPSHARALWALCKLDRATTSSHRVDRLRTVLGRLGRSHPDAPLLHYALFKQLDELDERAAAWAALEAGMKTRRAQVAYDPTEDRALVDHLTTLAPRVADQTTEDRPQPIFIVGLPRTGTTLLERILSGHPDVSDAGELHDFVLQLRWSTNCSGGPYLDHPLATLAAGVDPALVGERYLAHTRFHAQGRRFYTDKMPANFLNVGFILESLPLARIVHVKREPMDACFSNLKELFAGAYPHTYDIGEMAAYHHGYRRVMAHWHQVAPGRILDVEYEQLVSNPVGVAAAVFDHCGLQPVGETPFMRDGPVATASAVQVREPVHTRYVGQWRRYASELEPLRQALENAR